MADGPVFLRRANSKTFSTTFAGTENPLSESGAIITGLATGLDWTDVRSSGGFAFGTQTGDAPGAGQPNYDDSLACLTGTWGARQTVSGTIRTINQNATAFCEVELLLRFSISGHVARGYEVAFRAHKTSNPYIGIVRWNGALSDFFPLTGGNIIGSGVQDGDTISVSIDDDYVISAFINGVLQGTRQDTDAVNRIASGAPGFGMWRNNNGATGILNTDFGLYDYSAIAS